MKLTTKLEKIGNRLTNQWLAVAVSFVLILPMAGILGMGKQPIMVQIRKSARGSEAAVKGHL